MEIEAAPTTRWGNPWSASTEGRTVEGSAGRRRRRFAGRQDEDGDEDEEASGSGEPSTKKPKR